MVRISEIWAEFEKMSEWKKWAVYGFIFGVVLSLLYTYVNELNFITMPLVSIPIILLIGATIFNIVVLISTLLAPILSTAMFYMLVGILAGLLYERGYITARTVGGVAVIGLMALVIMQTVNIFSTLSPSLYYIAPAGLFCTTDGECPEKTNYYGATLTDGQCVAGRCRYGTCIANCEVGNICDRVHCVRCSFQVEILDKDTGAPLPGITVYNEQTKESKITNTVGKAFFYHPCDERIDLLLSKEKWKTGVGFPVGILTGDVTRQIQITVEGHPVTIPTIIIEPTTTTTTIISVEACKTTCKELGYYTGDCYSTQRENYIGRAGCPAQSPYCCCITKQCTLSDEQCQGECIYVFCDTSTGKIGLRDCCAIGKVCREEYGMYACYSPIPTTTTTITTTTTSTTSTTIKCTEGWTCRNSYKVYLSEDCKKIMEEYCPLGCEGGVCLGEPTTTTTTSTTLACRHGEVRDCLTPEGEIGQTVCVLGTWSKCTVKVKCETGETRACVTAEGEAGIQRCVEGKWTKCEKTGIPEWMIVVGTALTILVVLFLVLYKK